jgi:hypothetical protein
MNADFRDNAIYIQSTFNSFYSSICECAPAYQLDDRGAMRFYWRASSILGPWKSCVSNSIFDFHVQETDIFTGDYQD